MTMCRKLFIAAVMTISSSSIMAAENYEPARTASGKPDLQGFWSNASLTTMQRSSNYAEIGLSIPLEKLGELTTNNHQSVRQATDDGQVQGELPTGEDLGEGRGYNAFWVDPGSAFGYVKGEYRTSWITHPESGLIPYTEEGSRLRELSLAKFTDNNDGPEGRTLGERCLIGFGSSGGPPMNNVLYNNMYQIVQTDDYVVILVEMVHDARIIPIDKEHRPDALKPWLGDSVAHWDGDELVVETRNLHPQQGPTRVVPLSDEGVIIERFSRYSDEQILYEFEVRDSILYNETWGGEMAFNATVNQPYEYACHEGNYGLVGILSGARREEMEAQ